MGGLYTVGVFFGGPSSEFDVSCISASAVVKALEESGHRVVPIGVSRSGRWYAPVDADDIRTFAPSEYVDEEVVMFQRPGQTLYNAHTMSPVITLDVAFPIIHGSYGEDGHLQALFEMVGLPYVGASMAASVVGMDKIFMRDILCAHDIPQVHYTTTHQHAWQSDPQKVLDHIESQLPYPIFVKPANAGSSVGISKAESRDDLHRGIIAALAFDTKVLCEEGLQVREIELSALGNEQVEMTDPGEIFAESTFYDYEAKYQSDSSYTVIPADLSRDQKDTILDLAHRIYQVLDLSGFSRIDFFIDKDSGNVYFNEVNTLPGFTPISMYAKLWEAQGKSMPDLVDRLIELALERDREWKQGSQIMEGDY